LDKADDHLFFIGSVPAPEQDPAGAGISPGQFLHQHLWQNSPTGKITHLIQNLDDLFL